MKVYFDNAATTSMEPEVIELMYKTANSTFGNPSSIHSYGRKSKAAIEKVRKTIATYLNASPSEIIFTSCGTESNNMVLKMSIPKHNIKHLIVSAIEHSCILKTVEDIQRKEDIELHILKVDRLGRIDLSEFELLLKRLEGNVLVSIMHANNEIGTMIDLKAMGKICSQNKALFHSDTVQTIAHFPIDVKEINIDFLCGSAHKFYGPKGVGFLYMKQKSKVDAFLNGGGQERNLRSGTENLIGLIGMEKALQLSIENMSQWRSHIESLKSYFMDQLQTNIPDVLFRGDLENSLYHVLSVSFPEQFKTDMFLFELDINGIAVSGGSACYSGASKKSHVDLATQHPIERQSVRFSFSHNNTKKEIDYVIEVLKTFEKKNK